MPDPGWYPDPLGSPKLRLWTGTAWTEQLKDRSIQPDWLKRSDRFGDALGLAPDEPAPEERSGGGNDPAGHGAVPLVPDLLVAVGALAALVGVRLPWARVGVSPLSFPRYGTNIDGVWIIGLVAVVIGLLMFAFNRPSRPQHLLWGAVAAVGALVTLVSLVDLWAINLGEARITTLSTRATTNPQPGVFLTIGAGLAIFLGGTAHLAVRRPLVPEAGKDGRSARAGETG